jgi:hypothetical protein
MNLIIVSFNKNLIANIVKFLDITISDEIRKEFDLN